MQFIVYIRAKRIFQMKFGTQIVVPEKNVNNLNPIYPSLHSEFTTNIAMKAAATFFTNSWLLKYNEQTSMWYSHKL